MTETAQHHPMCSQTDRCGGQCLNTGFVVKDSGARESYPSGMVRDSQQGKPDYTLLPIEFLTRWADHMTKGAVKYGRHNWRLADSQDELERFQSSAFRHFVQWINGETDEDHGAAVAYNIAAADYVKGRLESNGS